MLLNLGFENEFDLVNLGKATILTASHALACATTTANIQVTTTSEQARTPTKFDCCANMDGFLLLPSPLKRRHEQQK